MAKLKSSKKVLIASLLVGALVLGAVVSLILVLAAPQQNVKTNVKVSYVVDGVGAKVSAKYAVVPMSMTQTVSKVSMTNSGDDSIEFSVGESGTTKNLLPSEENIELNTQNQRIVFEYSFTNLATSAFTIELTDLEETSTIENMNIFYHVTNREMSPDELRNSFSQTELGVQAITEQNKSIYIYVCVEVADETMGAQFETEFNWSLIKAESLIDVTLDNNGGTGSTTMKAIPNAVMPIVYTLPTLEGKAFGGYYVSSTQYVNENGLGQVVCPAESFTMTASWTDNPLVIDNGTLVGLTGAGENATTIEIPETVEVIGESAFANNETATSVTIPNSVTTIADSAFENNTSLQTVSFGDTATTVSYANSIAKLNRIGAKAFKGCSSLTELVIPNCVKYLANEILAGCTSLEKLEFPYVLTAGTSSVSGFSKLFGTSNTAIPTTLTTIVINGGTDIGKYAFSNCTSLESITMKSSVITIGNSAFSGCTGLTEVIIPSKVTSIGNSAFSGCTNLTSITIPDSVTSIGTSTFYNCNKLNYNTYGNAKYLGNSENPYVVLMVATNTSITSCNINEKTKFIYDKAFYKCTKLASITMPEILISIGDNVFYNCSKLTSITIPSSVTNIGSGAFSNCSGLTRVDTPSLESWFNINFSSTTSNPLHYANNLYMNGVKATEIEVPTTITKIKSNAFYNCDSLTAVTIPSSVTSIGSNAFINCINLTTVSIPSSVTSIGGSAFEGCGRLQYKTYGNAKYLGNSENSYVALINATSTSITNCEINPSTKVIANEAFRDCTGLTEIIIPNGVIKIGSNAFRDCTNLTSINIPESVISIGDFALDGCSSLTSITIPSSVTSIGWSVFNDCTRLNSVTIPSSVTFIDGYAFYNCTGLTSITIPSSVTSIGEHAFDNCTGLTSITIPSSVTSIGSYAFYNCTGLTEITIPSSVTSIESIAFSGCTGLTSIVVDSKNRVYNSANGSNCIIETATNSLIVGCQTTVLPNNIKSIGNYAFYNCKSLTSITIPESVTYIGTSAFAGCSRLVQVRNLSGQTLTGYTAPTFAEVRTDNLSFESTLEIENKYAIFTSADESEKVLLYATDKTITTVNDLTSDITQINAYAFYECVKLTEITIPSNITAIGKYAFYNTTALTTINFNATNCADLSSGNYIFYCSGQSGNGITVNIGASVTKIPAYLFSPYSDGTQKSPKIKLVNFAENSVCTSIGDSAFNRCASLTSIIIPSSVTSIGKSTFFVCSNLTSVTFDTTEGWWYASTETATSGTSLSSADLADTSTAARYLTTTYYNKYWKRG